MRPRGTSPPRAQTPGAQTPGSRRHPLLLGAVIGLVAANLRPALASIGPVLQDIRTDLALSETEVALLAAVGVVCLGAVAPIAPQPARRWGIEPVLAVVLGALTVGLIARTVAGTTVLFAGTILACGAIAVANVVLPALIKRDFPHHAGTMMGVYTMALSGSAAVAAGVTVPLGHLVGHGWRGALAMWAVPAGVALLLWVPNARGHTVPPAEPPASGRSLLRDGVAWQVTAFFGLQALGFYAVLAWLPTIYRDSGFSAAEAGWLLSVSAFVQAPTALVLPRIAGGRRDQRVYTAAATLLTAAGLGGVLAVPTVWPYVWMIVLGLGQGASFAVGLTLVIWRTRVSADTARLSAMAQTAGYLIAAPGPPLLGWVHNLTGSWSPATAVLLVLLLPQLVTGLLAGRRRYVGSRAEATAGADFGEGS